MAEELGEFAAQLRRPVLDAEDEEGLEELAVGGWLDRASWALERLEVEELGARLAAELLIAWQALARTAQDAPHAEERAALSASLEEVVSARGEALVRLGAGAFAFAAWGAALTAYEAEVGVPTAWSGEVAEGARVLIEGLDDALLFEAAAEALEVELDEATLDALQRSAVAGVEAAHSLVPAQIFIRAVAATLDVDMRAASGTYPLWLALMEAREAWAVGEVFARAAVASHEHAAQAPAPVVDLAAFRARKQAALAARQPQAAELMESIAQQVRMAADDGSAPDGPRRAWRGESGWSAWLRLPTARMADDAVVRLFVEEQLPCAGAVFLIGIGRMVAADAFAVEFTAGELRGAGADELALVFVGEDGRVEVGTLVCEDRGGAEALGQIAAKHAWIGALYLKLRRAFDESESVIAEIVATIKSAGAQPDYAASLSASNDPSRELELVWGECPRVELAVGESVELEVPPTCQLWYALSSGSSLFPQAKWVLERDESPVLIIATESRGAQTIEDALASGARVAGLILIERIEAS